MSNHDLYHDWFALIEISGPFLAVPVLKEAFPQGLEELDGLKRKDLRQAYEEWREALETDDPQFDELHRAWIDEVLSRGLDLDEDSKGDVLKRAEWCAANLNISLAEHGVTLAPNLAVVDEQRDNKPLMLIHTYGQDVDLDATLKLDGWATTPPDRMVQLCRATGCRLGLVTNGERWMLVDAPVGAVTTFASWYARIWSQEPITLQAFVHLLGIRRFFVDEAEQLPALFDRSLKYQDEVTNALGEQVRRAVEVLIQALDKADQDRDRELLRNVKEPVLYEAALTVMMRLVFLLSAEERGLLLLGDERYEANYALSTLRMQLRTESEEILERRWDAWSRLLAIFRAVFGGIEYENLRLPAMGGSLFDPDRFPFLEGRPKGSDWRTDIAKPLPIDNRTVLLLLEAIQQFQGRTLSYRALDVEQIGYVYEGLLERTVKRTAEVTLELDGTKSARAPWVTLAELESARLDGPERLAELLQGRSGSSASRVRNDLAKPVDDTLTDRLLAACHGETVLRDRIKPFAHLVRTDPWGYPLVYPAGAFVVTTGSDRRETGTHYTPKSLTEAIVAETLTPVAYIGPAEGTPREQWALKSPAQLLDLKICDPAMGSGAFLVQTCRWLSDRLVEAWSQVEALGMTVSVDGDVLDAGTNKELLPRDSEARTVIARRLIAERCLYGVDLNPLAVELAKLSIWLVTLAKGRPFGFLDHNLRWGDSLLGVLRLDQLTELLMTPTGKGQQRLFGENIERAVHEAVELRQRLRGMPIRDIHDVETMARLHADARQKLEVPERIADAFVGDVLVSGSNAGVLDKAVASLAIQAGQAIASDQDAFHALVRRAGDSLSVDLPSGKSGRKPFHWPLEFPEVLTRVNSGFDAIIGNPPFLGGKKISTSLGVDYFAWLKNGISSTKGAADLSAYFFVRSMTLLRSCGTFGLIATNTICQGDTREVGLAKLEQVGAIYTASPTCPWPGAAGVDVAIVHYFNGQWNGVCALNGSLVLTIDSRLEAGKAQVEPVRLFNSLYGTKGTYVHGEGFIIDDQTKSKFVNANPRNQEVLQRYLNARDFTTQPDQLPTRWVINFKDYQEETAASYAEPFAHLVETVKPARDKLTRQIHEKCFWKHWDRRDELYRNISKKNQVIVCPEVSKHCCFSLSPSDLLFSHMVNVIPNDSYGVFAVLQSNIHVEWAWRYGSTMRNAGIRYTTSDCLSTFPPPGNTSELESIGSEYFHSRDAVMRAMSKGLTSFYNRLNDKQDSEHDIEKMRQLQLRLDRAVIAAYGWDDLSVSHGFFESKQGVRYSISIADRTQILCRLLELNIRRYEEEIAQGLQAKGAVRSIASNSRAPRATGANFLQPELDFDTSPRGLSLASDSARSVLDFLRARTGWHAKGDILAATGVSDGQWNAAINSLIAVGKVERQGEKRGTRYREVRGEK